MHDIKMSVTIFIKKKLEKGPNFKSHPLFSLQKLNFCSLFCGSTSSHMQILFLFTTFSAMGHLGNLMCRRTNDFLKTL